MNRYLQAGSRHHFLSCYAALGLIGIFDDDVAAETAPRCPAAFDGCISRLYDRNEVVHDSVRHRFVKNSLVAKPLKIHFQTLQLDAHLIRNVSKDEGAEVGLSSFGTDRSEFGTVMFDAKIP